MRKNNKEVKTSKLEAFVKAQLAEPTVLSYQIGDDKLEVRVNPVLPFAKRMEMIRSIAGMLFTADGSSIDNYMPGYDELAKKIMLVMYYTDLDVPQDVGDAWILLKYTTLFDDVTRVLGEDVDKIFDVVDKIVAVRRDYLVNKTDINTLFNKITEKVDALGSQFTKQDLDTVLKMMEKLPQNISAESLVQAVAAVEKENSNNN